MLSPFLFTLLTHDCIPLHNSNLLIKFVEDTRLDLTNNNNKTSYRSKVRCLTSWCVQNNLYLNVEKTKEIVVDFRRAYTQYPPLTTNVAGAERVSSTKFLGVHISEDPSWTTNTSSLAKKANQCLHLLRKLRGSGAMPLIMCPFYKGTIKSILPSCITVHPESSGEDHRHLPPPKVVQHLPHLKSHPHRGRPHPPITEPI